MLDLDKQTDSCPQCQANLAPYREVGAMPSFCLQCKFPLMLVAGKYRLQGKIGQGAVGTVYLSRHVKLNHNAERVVKVIKQELLDNPNTISRFEREVQVTAELSERNEHIVRIYDDFGEVPHLGYFYVMEFIRGVSMRKYIRNLKNLPTVAWCLEVMRQLCEALHTAHEVGVVHRDLKPDNLMLTEKGTSGIYLKVLDWGIAKPLTIVDENLTQGLVGTPHYMAPEQAMNVEIDSRTDLYALGVILYELLTGINPFVAATGKKGKSHESMVDLIQAHLYEEPPPIHALTPQREDVTKELEQVIYKALEKKPSDRYPSVMAFYEALRETAILSGVQTSFQPTGSFQPLPTATGSYPPSGEIPSGGQIPSGEVGSGAPLATVSSNTPPFSHQLDNAQKTTLDGPDSLQPAQVTKQPPPPPTTNNLSSVLLGLCALLLGLSGYLTYHFLSKPTKQPPDTRLTQTRITPTSRPLKRTPRMISPEWVDAGAKAAPAPVPDTRVVVPVRRIPPIPDQRSQRPIRTFRPRPRPRRRRICAGGMMPIFLRPFINSRAEITAEPGRIRRINSRLLCVSKRATQVSIVQEGFAPCVFSVPKRRRKLKVVLQNADSAGLSGQCLRSR